MNTMHGANPAYAPWNIEESVFPVQGTLEEQLRFAAAYGVLAPSSHNTQPWLFSISSQGIFVYADFSRRLSLSDPTDREFYISLGCCIENIEIALRHFGLFSRVEFFPIRPSPLQPELVAHFTPSQRPGPEEIDPRYHEWFFAIPKRVSAKLLYQDEPLPGHVIQDIEQFSEEGISAHYFFEKKDVQHVAHFVEKGTRHAFKNSGFRKELSAWVRSNWTKRSDGMPAFTMGIPGPISLIAPFILKYIDMGSTQARDMLHLLAHTPGVGVFTAVEDAPLFWMRAGCLYERVSLYLLTLGYYTALLGALVEHPDIRFDFQKSFGFSGKPVVCFRIGIPKKIPPRSPRRPLASCMLTE